MLLWMDYADELLTEWKQCIEEGLDASAYKELMEQIKKMPPSPERYRLADEVFSLVQTLPQQEGYAYNEPSDWDAIQACLPQEQPFFPACRTARHCLSGYTARGSGGLSGACSANRSRAGAQPS